MPAYIKIGDIKGESTDNADSFDFNFDGGDHGGHDDWIIIQSSKDGGNGPAGGNSKGFAEVEWTYTEVEWTYNDKVGDNGYTEVEWTY